MKIAIPEWSGNVCTVFDFAHWLLVVEVNGSDEVSRISIPLKEKLLIERARKLKHLDVQLLICGAISCPLARIISSYGIKIISHIRGTIDEVLNAYLTGKLDNPKFFFPGYSPRSNSIKNNIISDW